MRFIKDFRQGLSAFLQAWSFMRKHGLMHYLLYPLFITVLLWLGGMKVMTESVSWLRTLTDSYLQIPIHEMDPESGFWQNSWETMKSWLNSGSGALLSIIVSLSFMILMFLTTKYVMLALLSPALAMISERAEEILSDCSYPFSLGRFLKDVGRGILVSLRNMFLETSLLILIWAASLFFPFILPATAILSLFITSYYYGFSMLDYLHERKQIPLGEGAQRIRGMKGVAVALGLGLALCIQIPLIGFILAGTASLMAAVAAVIMDKDEQVNRAPIDA